MKLSVIIANYNYADFVGAAISSALAVDWPDKEVIVVDDASTDDSRSVIDGFRGKVAPYFRPKSNQLGAHIFGFEQSTGDVIIFLDADDLLEPDVISADRRYRTASPNLSAHDDVHDAARVGQRLLTGFRAPQPRSLNRTPCW
jgi:glycosyltransferase involved in cell wall biosynthesis